MGIDYKKIKSWPIPSTRAAYTRDDTIRFARGIGVGMPGPLQAEEAKFISDNGALVALPMMAVILNEGAMWTQDPETRIDWTQTIHAEESITLHRLLPVQAELVADYRVDEIYDKGANKGALMYESRLLKDPDGSSVATIQIGTFLRRNGGFGGSSEGAPQPHVTPADLPPGDSVEVSTPVGRDAIYCLGAEFVDALRLPDLRADQAVLRGACAFGVAGRGVLKLCCNNDPARLKFMKLRYAGPIFTGETLRVDIWNQEPGRAAFVVHAVERDVVVMKNGCAEFTPG